MTKEERTEKWSRSIPEMQDMSLEEKLKICNIVAKQLTAIIAVCFLALLVLFLIDLFLSDNPADSISNRLADWMNAYETQAKSLYPYNLRLRTLYVACHTLPLMLLPIAVLLFAFMRLRSPLLKRCAENRKKAKRNRESVMISTKDVTHMLLPKQLQKICKAIAAMELIMWEGQDEYRCYSYNSCWDDNEEVFEMNNGEGQRMLVLFSVYGCVISGMDSEHFYVKGKPRSIENLTEGLPDVFREFMYGEPIKSLGTTFCTWSVDNGAWTVGKIDDCDDGSEGMLALFDGDPQTYVEFAKEYYEKNIPVETVSKIYENETITREMVLMLNNEYESWDALKEGLESIKYPFSF